MEHHFFNEFVEISLGLLGPALADAFVGIDIVGVVAAISRSRAA